ncbi:MAG: twin-arginine translocation signal domain-containing protein, partial [Phycisphaerae bacterium]|nr:twin-arginine translocation signal domain-containing protein [Phycisphaerae bacterium]
MDRRDFLKMAGSTAVAGSVVSGQAAVPPNGTSTPEIAPPQKASIRVTDNILHIDTATQTAVMEKGVFTSLKSKQTGDVFIREVDVTSCPALQLLYRGGQTVPVDESKFGTIETHALSEHRAEVVFHSWDA